MVKLMLDHTFSIVTRIRTRNLHFMYVSLRVVLKKQIEILHTDYNT